MSVSATSSDYTTTSTSSTSTTRETSGELDKDAFLKILIAQLSNQDPMDPLKDTDFIAQMAQFSTLEQMTNMNDTLTEMNSISKGSAVNYIGRVVEYHDDEGLSAYAEVSYVRFDSTGTVLVSTEAKEIPLEEVIAVA